MIGNPQQLLLVKHLYDDAAQLAVHEDDLSITKAIILLDLAVEQMLNLLVRDLTTNPSADADPGRSDITWKRLWQLAITAMKEQNLSLLHYKELSSLHEIRNLAQHNGSVPTQSELRRYVHPVAEMLSRAFRDAYNLDFANFRSWDIVPNEGISRWMNLGEDSLRVGDPLGSVVGCVVAHGRIITALRERRKRSHYWSPVGRHLRSRTSESLEDNEISMIISEIEDAKRELREEMNALEDEVVALGIGLPVSHMRRFLHAGSVVSVAEMSDGNLHVNINEDLNDVELKKRATFMLDYLSRLTRLVSIDSPGVLESVEMPKISEEWFHSRKDKDDAV